jgi:hypothetical protein
MGPRPQARWARPGFVTSEVHTATCSPLLELLDQVPPRCWALLLLATFASLRFGELAGLRRRDLDLDACVIRVTVATAETDDGRLIDHDPKSRAGRRTVAFPEEIGPELRWHVACFAQAGDDGLVFIGPKGRTAAPVELPADLDQGQERSGHAGPALPRPATYR